MENLIINLSMDKTLKSYPAQCLPARLKKRNGKAKKCGFEDINLNLYEPEAEMVPFHTSHQRLLSWIKAMEILYYDDLGKQEDFTIDWQDIPIR